MGDGSFEGFRIGWFLARGSRIQRSQARGSKVLGPEVRSYPKRRFEGHRVGSSKVRRSLGCSSGIARDRDFKVPGKVIEPEDLRSRGPWVESLKVPDRAVRLSIVSEVPGPEAKGPRV